MFVFIVFCALAFLLISLWHTSLFNSSNALSNLVIFTLILPNRYMYTMHQAVADPGFPVGGRGPRRGAVDPRGSYVSKILHVKMKESGPVGGARPLRSANAKLLTELFV